MLYFRYKLVLKKKKNRKRSKPASLQGQQAHRPASPAVPRMACSLFLSRNTLDQNSKSLNEIHGSLWFDN
jgi:hypothetical protein